MQIFRSLAGYSLGRADIVRRAMSKKKHEVMEREKQIFIHAVFSRKEHWSGLPFPSPGDLPNLGIEPGSPSLQADSLSPEPPEKPLYVRLANIKSRYSFYRKFVQKNVLQTRNRSDT